MGTSKKHNVCLYVKDPDTFRTALADVSHVYYEKYRQYPTQAEMLDIVISIAQEVLTSGSAISGSASQVSDFFGWSR